MSSTLGIICIGMAFIAIGMFVSSLTENQLAAAIITVTIIVAMLIMNLANDLIENQVIRFIIDWVCFISRFAPFSAGQFDPSALLYYVSITGVFLLLTVRVYDKRRWG
jgi:ABC-2 type transport system permease protein